MNKESMVKTLVVSSSLCIVCSVLVSGAAVTLRPKQNKNKLLDKRMNILKTAKLIENDKLSESEVSDIYQKHIDSKILDLKENSLNPDVDPLDYDQRKAAKDPKQNIRLTDTEDIANNGQIARNRFVYFVRKDGMVEQIILPVEGKGLWSTLYGFLSLDRDLKTITGLSFYEHAETPGLGGEVDNPKWKALWTGKKAFGPDGDPRIQVIKGKVDKNTEEPMYKVDGLAGATITSRGVSMLLRFWLGEHGYGPYLDKLKNKINTEEAVSLKKLETRKEQSNHG